jgi:hypothetical protein
MGPPASTGGAAQPGGVRPDRTTPHARCAPSGALARGGLHAPCPSGLQAPRSRLKGPRALRRRSRRHAPKGQHRRIRRQARSGYCAPWEPPWPCVSSLSLSLSLPGCRWLLGAKEEGRGSEESEGIRVWPSILYGFVFSRSDPS